MGIVYCIKDFRVSGLVCVDEFFETNLKYLYHMLRVVIGGNRDNAISAMLFNSSVREGFKKIKKSGIFQI